MPSLSKFGTAVLIAFLSSCTVAQQLTIDAALFPYIAPGLTDSRGPCPVLNASANHGILPRDGKNIDMAMAQAASKYLGMGDAPAGVVISGALKASTTGNTLFIGHFAQHTPQQVEYDGPISRLDAQSGKPGPSNQEVWDRSQSSWALGTDDITNNPTYQKALGQVGALLNYANLFYAFGLPSNGNANRTMVKTLFEQERLSLELGWTPPKDISTVFELPHSLGRSIRSR